MPAVDTRAALLRQTAARAEEKPGWAWVPFQQWREGTQWEGECVTCEIRRRNVHTKGPRQEHASPFKTEKHVAGAQQAGGSGGQWDYRKPSSV